jgi:microsomal dipeptidase-like Zn-dependent dipeptidase
MSVQKYYADSMAFLGLQGQPPVNCSQLSLAHITSVPPFIKDADAALAVHQTFKRQALSEPNKNVHEVLTRPHLDRPASMAMLFGMQHAPAKMTLALMWRFRNAGIRSMAIAYDSHTEYGCGFKGSTDRLTGNGMKLIEWMAETGIILDISHAGHMTARMALDFIRQENLPMKPMASHSGCYAVFPHPRNLPDDILERIVDLEGYVGIPALTFIIAKRNEPYLDAVVRHLKYSIGKGCRTSIGSDCNHIDMTMEAAAIHFATMTKMLETEGTFGEYFPDRPPELIENGSRMFEMLEKKLLEAKMPVSTVENILGQNFRSFLARALPVE